MSEQKKTKTNPIDQVIAAIQAGEMVVVVDHEHRENEGDLICAAEKATPQIINFMATHGRGLICVALDQAIAQRLDLTKLPRKHAASEELDTAFTESVDAREGITTGISAADRAHTIHLMASPGTPPEALTRPGHVFPLIAHPDGILGRHGHTEAATDLTRLAGLEPAGVICEILNPDGSMARFPDLCSFAQKHGLKICSVDALIQYRQTHITAS